MMPNIHFIPVKGCDNAIAPFVSFGSPLQGNVLGDIPHFDGAGHKCI